MKNMLDKNLWIKGIYNRFRLVCGRWAWSLGGISIIFIVLWQFLSIEGFQILGKISQNLHRVNTIVENIRDMLPLGRTVLSLEKLDTLTLRNSPSPRIIFPKSTDATNTFIPEFPQLDQLPAINASADLGPKNEDKHSIAVVQALDAQYSYANRIRDAMVQLLESHPHMKNARANATIFMLCRNQDIALVLRSLSSFEFVFNRQYHYPYTFLNNEPFTEEFKDRVRAAVSPSQVEFGLIPKEHWSLPENIDPMLYELKLKKNGKRYVYGDSRSYRFMCRYNSRFFYKHPLLQKYRYYWRVEPNIRYNCMMRYDPLLFMALAKKRYGFTIMASEFLKTVEGLWRQTMEFMKDEQLPLSQFLLEGFYDPKTNDYNGNHFWSNFEIADMDFYRSQIYERYMQALDRSKGFFYERYGDAPVHSIAAAMLLHPEELHHFSDISYHHDDHGTCPKTKNATFSEFQKICWCYRDGSWVENDWWPSNLLGVLGPLNKYSFNMTWT